MDTNRLDQHFFTEMPLPEPMDDELIYSVCCRYHILSGNQHKDLSSVLLTGLKTAYRHPLLPVGLNILEIASDGRLRGDDNTIRSRSILKAYLPLLPQQRRIKLFDACRGSNPTVIKARSGLSRYNECAHLLKFCSMCVSKQVDLNGFSFWKTTHQLPGHWICLEHKQILHYVLGNKPQQLNWTLPQQLRHLAVTPSLSSTQMLCLLGIMSIIDWISEHSYLDTSILHVMLRKRFRGAGCVRSELKISSMEADHLALAIPAFYANLPVPDLARLNQVWFGGLFKDFRHYNPLTWALALAYAGDTSQLGLDRDLHEAQSRIPQRELFRKIKLMKRKRQRAPNQLYFAFSDALLKRDVAEVSGLSDSEVNRWLLKDPLLKLHWQKVAFQRKLKEAVANVKRVLMKHPKGQRIHLIKECSQSYRWLKLNNPKIFFEIVPPSRNRNKQQIQLDFKF